ncbi:hypothetical protein DUI87_02230 [Hirundo rustica rustica]|uniref:ribonuclease H n=1 Tax=Hirundo rustica rustica TaxID=333673 RepID=A0A3M0L7L7_HIRRU|nr:hypothetical protein DUI87_02230 [Hirundo rustica rustica]
MAPLREAVGPQGDRVMVKVPFSPNDLMIWKQSAGSYREDPDRTARVVKMVIKTQNPDWNDLQVLLDTLMDSTEKEMVLRAMTEKAREMIRLRVADGTLNELVPREDPEWDPNTARGHQALKEYQELLIEGVRTGIPKTVNWSKLYSVKQEKNESPSAFLERLKETARRYTSLEVEGEAGRLQLALIFMGQSQEDIRKKLQKLEGEDTRNLEKLLEVAWKVYNNRERNRSGSNKLACWQYSSKPWGEARIIFEGGRVKLEIPEENIGKMFIIKEVEPQPITEEIEQAVVPWVWETGTPGKSKAAQPVVVELKEGKEPVRLKQYAIKPEVRREVAPIIDQYLNLGILQECESEYNTPIFPVKKPNGKYRLVQDLRAINEITKDIHPVVANPYTLLTSVSEKFEWFTVIDLKDAFFCIPLALGSRKYFAFEWEKSGHRTKKAADLEPTTTGIQELPYHFWKPTSSGTRRVEDNPAEFLRSDREEGELVHDCVEIIEQVYASREDLKDAPIDSPDWELFTDGSSFVENGTRDEILLLLEAVREPEAVAVMHVPGHRKEDGKIYQGNRLADKTAKRVAKEIKIQSALIPAKGNPADSYMKDEPPYLPDDVKLAPPGESSEE